MDRKSWQSSWGQAPQSVSTHPVNSTGKWCEVSAQLLMVRQVHHALNNICIFHSFIWHLLINLLFLGTVNVIQCTGLTTEWYKTVLIKKVFQSTMCVRQISEHNVIRVLIKVWKNCSVTMRLMPLPVLPLGPQSSWWTLLLFGDSLHSISDPSW